LYRKRLLWLNRDRQEAGKDRWRERESFNVKMVGRSQDLLRRLLDEAYDTYALTVRQQSRIYLSVYSYWVPQGFMRPRPLDSVYLPDRQKEQMYEDLQQFLESESWYHEMGIPYRRGYLLHGVPGSGKSSLVAAVAGAVGMHLYVVNLPGITDQGLQELLRNVSAPRAIVLVEDIDGAHAAQARDGDRDEKAQKADVLTVSGLLNALDGVASRDGYVTIMTTNRRESLDPALTRPGRVDMEIGFEYATQGQAQALYQRFYGKPALALHGEKLGMELPGDASMAMLQGHFLRHRNDPIGAAALHRMRIENSGLKALDSSQ
jgi:chaperone BCS1